MRKKLVLFSSILLLSFVLSACNDSNDSTGNASMEADKEEVDKEVEPLTLQLQKEDEEAGETVENNVIYSDLAEAIEDEPQLGIPNDFSLQPMDIAEFEDGSTSIVFLAINRLDDDIQNISLDLTLGNQDGEYIFEAYEVFMPEEQYGVIESNSAVPFIIDITPEEEKLYMTLDEGNVDMDMENFDMEIVE